MKNKNMSKEIKQRREQLSGLVEKAENLMEELIQFKRKEGDYNNVEDLDYAESNLDECITSLNNHYYEHLS
jgi:hypothetical protein